MLTEGMGSKMGTGWGSRLLFPLPKALPPPKSSPQALDGPPLTHRLLSVTLHTLLVLGEVLPLCEIPWSQT